MQLVDREFYNRRARCCAKRCADLLANQFIGAAIPAKQVENERSTRIEQMYAVAGRIVDQNLLIQRVAQQSGSNSWKTIHRSI